MEVDSNACQENNKKIRRRKKKLLGDIMKQIEFYLSDANLRKDRYLRQKMKESGEEMSGMAYISLDEFLNFNKIKCLTDNTQDIAMALKSSDLLELNENETAVRRKVPVDNSKDTDSCTIYVEKLPQHADLDWIWSTFEPYGRIVYVSLPRFKKNGKIKGFAFIEFDHAQCVVKACEHFGASIPEALLKKLDLNTDSPKGVDMEDIPDSIKRGLESDEEEAEDNRSKRVKCEPPEPEEEVASIKSEEQPQPGEVTSRRPKKKPSCKQSKKSGVGECMQNVKVKSEEMQTVEVKCEDMQNVEVKSENMQNVEVKSEDMQNIKVKSENMQNLEVKSEEMKDGEESKREKKKNRRKHRRQTDTESVMEDEKVITLRVMSKYEWLDYKQKYVELQKDVMSKIKSIVNAPTSIHIEEEGAAVEKVVKKPNPSGVILRLTFERPSSAKFEESLFRSEIREVAGEGLAYIDLDSQIKSVNDQLQRTCYLRYSGKEEALAALNSEKLLQIVKDIVLLEGEEEENYWERVRDFLRKRKEQKEQKTMRGKKRLTTRTENVFYAVGEKKVNTHIKFV